MLCDEVKRAVYFFLDGSLAESKLRDLSEHLGLCPDCELRMEIQRRLRLFVRRRLVSIQAPDHLRRRLQRSLRAFAE